MTNWFDINKEGLARILKRRGLQFVAFELISNAWDSAATHVDVTLEAVPGKRQARLVVRDDDPQGFTDITDCYTMFADSSRRADAQKRGRFNLGEKLALAVATEAFVITTTAAFHFDQAGRHRSKLRREKGSEVELFFPATHADIQGILESMTHLIPPMPTTINGELLRPPSPICDFGTSLETVLPDDEGSLKPCVRKTTVAVYQNGPGWLLELGIPVVETGDTYSYNVSQKVPLNMDRDNVPPAYLRTLRVMALNATHKTLDIEASNSTWVGDALQDKRVAPEAVQSAIAQRFGPKVVSFDLTDLEANNKAVAEGYTVVHGRSLPASTWENVRKAEAIQPAGRVCPTPKPFSPNGKPITLIPENEWTAGMRQIANYTRSLFRAWFGHEIEVYMAKPRKQDWGACYGPDGKFFFGVSNLPHDWFDHGITDDVVELLIHEGGHEKESNHLSSHFNDVLAELGAKMRRLGHLDKEE